jgi:hypothetical protein
VFLSPLLPNKNKIIGIYKNLNKISMNDIILIGKQEYRQLTDQLNQIVGILNNPVKSEPIADYFTPKEFQKKFGISQVTQWKLRKAGKLPYRTIGKQIFYKLSEIESFCKS